jgi:uncharacterized membrane protein
MSTTMMIILAGAVLTYLTRAGGHAVLSRFQSVHPRVDAALNAVPAAVLTTLVAPAAAQGGVLEIASLAAMALLSSRIGMLAAFLVAAALLVAGRQAGF